MWFYPKRITSSAVEALREAGLTFTEFGIGERELSISDEEIAMRDDFHLMLRGVRLVKEQVFFNGHIDAPKTWSSLEGAMVPSGVDLNQCRICGYWMDRKMTPSDERRHDQQCEPHYEWRLAEQARVS